MRVLLLSFLLLTGCAHPQSGLRLKIVSRSESSAPGAPAPESTTVFYALGPNRRIERHTNLPAANHPASDIVMIQRCEDHVMYALNLATREYMELQVPQRQGSDGKPASTAPNVFFDVTTVDTGETKQAFGHTARHYVTTTKQTSAPELKVEPSETVEDVWYLNLPDVMQCNGGSHRPHGVIGSRNSEVMDRNGLQRRGPPPVPEFRYHGPDPPGLALSSKSVRRTIGHYVYGDPYPISTTFTSEIVELKEQAVDPALFQVPAGFTKVARFTH